MDKQFEAEVKQFFEEVGVSVCKRAGLGSTVAAFYMGMDPSSSHGGSFDEVVSELELTRKEIKYWEDLWYKKDSWLNQMS